MLQAGFIRENLQLVKDKLQVRNFKYEGIPEQVIALDDKRKGLQLRIDDLNGQINLRSKEIGQLMIKKETNAAEHLMAQVAEHKLVVPKITIELLAVEKELHDVLIRLPNLPHSSVPAGKAATDNLLVREGGLKPNLSSGSFPHWDLAKKFDLIDFELGNKLTGSGFPVYKGKGAKLQRALIQYFLDFNIGKGYTEYQPPLMVNEATAYGTGQLPDKEGQMYQIPLDGFYLIPTAEVPITNIYRNEIIKEADLPIKMTAYTPCFRREAGSYGKDVRGLNRLHQFDKVEIIQITDPQKSYITLEEMVMHVEELLVSLQLPYRILRLCGGDMGFTSALTYDFEVYSAAQDKWLEVSSVSNFETFQTNRMKIRFKDAKGKMQLAHTLNGSSLALPRILAALLENNQTDTGIKIPDVLQPYFGSSLL